MNDRRKKGLEKEISIIIGMTILTEVKNEKIKNLVTIHKTELTKDGRYLDLTFSILDLKNNVNKEKILEELEKLIPIAEQMWIDWRGKLPDDYVSPLK